MHDAKYTWPAIGRDAAFELDCMARAAGNALATANQSDEVVTARGMLARIMQLSDILFESFVQDDENERDVTRAARRLYLTE